MCMCIDDCRLDLLAHDDMNTYGVRTYIHTHKKPSLVHRNAHVQKRSTCKHAHNARSLACTTHSHKHTHKQTYMHASCTYAQPLIKVSLPLYALSTVNICHETIAAIRWHDAHSALHDFFPQKNM
jgi:hypothetical protein